MNLSIVIKPYIIEYISIRPNIYTYISSLSTIFFCYSHLRAGGSSTTTKFDLLSSLSSHSYSFIGLYDVRCVLLSSSSLHGTTESVRPSIHRCKRLRRWFPNPNDIRHFLPPRPFFHFFGYVRTWWSSSPLVSHFLRTWKGFFFVFLSLCSTCRSIDRSVGGWFRASFSLSLYRSIGRWVGG